MLVDLEGVRVTIEARSSQNGLDEDLKARVSSGISAVAAGIVVRPDGRFDTSIAYFDRTGLNIVRQTAVSLDGLGHAIHAARQSHVQDDLTAYHVEAVERVIDACVREGLHEIDGANSTGLALRLSETLGLTAKARVEQLSGELLRIAVFMLFDAILSDRNASNGMARDILNVIPDSPGWSARLSELRTVATSVRRSGVLARHDFMGRLFHKILLRTTGEAYATYYTAIPTAYLLARIAVEMANGNFRTPKQIEEIRIGDLACGSGTLLSAAYTAVRDRYVTDCDTAVDMDALHKALVERSIWGVDVLEYAAHLTSTTLTLHHDDGGIAASNIWRVPVGASATNGTRLGSLDLYDETSIACDGEDRRVTLPQFDLLIMNPPFSRSSGPKVTFGYDLPNKPKLVERMKAIARERGFRKMLVAGMGAFFVPLAIQYAKEGGLIAFVLPRALLSGVSWEEVRKIVERACHVEMVISNHDPGHRPVDATGRRGKRTRGWAFSEETDIGEVLFVARKRSRPSPNETTRYVNIFEYPRNEYEAMAFADRVLEARRERVDCDVTFEGRVVGNTFSVKAETIASYNWLAPALFASKDLTDFTLSLIGEKNLCEFRAFADSYGCDISAEKKVFEQSAAETAFPMLWTHGIKQDSLLLSHGALGFGTPRIDRRKAQAFFAGKAARLLIAERPHLKTTPAFALLSETGVLATPCWEVRLKDAALEPIAALWLNSTYGIVLMLSAATSSQGEIFKLKRDQLESMLVLDFNRIDREAAMALWQAISREQLQNLGESASLAATGRGVRYRIDCFFSRYLARQLTPQLYSLLASEPIVTHKRRNVR